MKVQPMTPIITTKTTIANDGSCDNSVLVECIHVMWVSIRRRIFTSGQNEMCSFLRQYSLFFKLFFLNERPHLDYYLDLKSDFGKNCRSGGIQ